MLNLGKPSFGIGEIVAVAKVIRSGWVGRGKQVAELEKEVAGYTGAKYAVAVNGCTPGLFLSLKYLGIGPGDEVIVPSITWNATAAVVVMAGATPVFADVLAETWCLDPQDALRRITPRTKAIIPVHYAGRFAAGFENFPVPVIYDSAHRLEKNDFRGTTSVLSFYVTKNMTTVRGGMVLTNSEKEAAWLKVARSSGINKDVLKRYNSGDYNYEVEFPSWNFDMSDVEAAIGRVQFKKLEKFTARREEIVATYNKAFGLHKTGNHLYTILVENREEFMDNMKHGGVQCGVHYFALHLMKGYAPYKTGTLEHSEFISRHNVSLPLFPGMTNKDVQAVIRGVKRYAKLLE